MCYSFFLFYSQTQDRANIEVVYRPLSWIGRSRCNRLPHWHMAFETRVSFVVRLLAHLGCVSKIVAAANRLHSAEFRFNNFNIHLSQVIQYGGMNLWLLAKRTWVVNRYRQSFIVRKAQINCAVQQLPKCNGLDTWIFGTKAAVTASAVVNDRCAFRLTWIMVAAYIMIFHISKLFSKQCKYKVNQFWLIDTHGAVRIKPTFLPVDVFYINAGYYLFVHCEASKSKRYCFRSMPPA